MNTEFLINKKLDDETLQKLSALTDDNEPPVFAIVGEIAPDGKYSSCVLLGTKTHIFAYNISTEECTEKYAIADITEIYTKRMYGNGVLRLKIGEDKTLNIFRFTFSVTALCDAAVSYVKNIRDGEAFAEARDMMEAVYQKMLSVCPKCGRALSAPGVPCIHCMKKGRVLKKLSHYLKPEMPILIVSVFISVLTTALALVPPTLTRFLVDDILIENNENSRRSLMWVVIALVAIHIVHYIFSGIRSYMLRISGHKIIARLRRDVYEKAQYLPMQFYDKTSTGAVINRISGDTSTIMNFMLRITQEVVVQFFKLIGIVLLMLFINPTLTLLSLLPIPIVVIISRVFRKKIAPFYRKIWRRSSAVTSVLTDTLPGIRVIKSFTHEKKSVERFNDCVEEWRATDQSAGKIISAFPAIVNCLISCGGVVIWALGGNMVINGIEQANGAIISTGVLVSFISYASMFYEPVSFFTNLSDSMQNALASTERIMDILDAEPEHDFGKGKKDADMGGRIVFENVNFSFDRTKKILKNINLTIEPGDIVGIVGTTGSGKSTLINLLLRYYDHYEGKISVGGVDIRDIDMEYYRSRIGYVQQEPQMFHDTIYNNIAYGDEAFSVDEVINAADIANAHEFIIRQPDGYDSVLGERGVGLSGGEKQRISIARAMLRNPQMLVFDEATASVDSETEHLIQDAIEKLISGRTTLMIAHRLSTLSKANKIIVVDNGEIIECGTPDELLEKKGKYYKLVEIQSMSDKLNESRRAVRFS